jgi:aarF domain-containing kinase
MFLRDFNTLNQICSEWGIHDVNMFASATLQKPYNPNKVLHLNEKISAQDVYEMQLNAKDRLKKFLADTEKIPLELIFLGRTLNLLRSNNKFLGSPVNRINIMANWAAKGLGTPDLKNKGFISRLRGSFEPNVQYFVFNGQLLLLSMGFYFNRILQLIRQWWTHKREGGFEDVLDKQFAASIEQQLGTKINLDETFSG